MFAIQVIIVHPQKKSAEIFHVGKVETRILNKLGEDIQFPLVTWFCNLDTYMIIYVL